MRNHHVHSGIAFASLSLLVACGGSGGGGPVVIPPPVVPPVLADWYVDAGTGNDANAGTFQAPFKTIRHALTLVAATQTIYAAPGLYDAANGEAFPLDIPTAVTLLGDEPNKGDAAVDTVIQGGGMAPPPFPSLAHAAVLLRTGAVIAGFQVIDDLPAGPTVNPYGLLVPEPGTTIRNNTIHGAAAGGIFVFNGSVGHSIASNVIRDNGGPGLGFINGGVGSRVEFNLITQNEYGVEFDAPGGDLGGGAAGSLGGNTISCNTTNDIWLNSAITVDAQNNFWDHNPPTTGTANEDLLTFAGAAYVLTGAAVATSPCP